jgi:hypothetical protein
LRQGLAADAQAAHLPAAGASVGTVLNAKGTKIRPGTQRLTDPGRREAASPPSDDASAANPAVRLSALLARVARDATGERVTVGEVVDVFARRAFGALLVLFAAPNVLPVALPGLSLVFGVPLMLLCLQMAWGREEPWLPRFVRDRSLATRDFRRIVETLSRPLARIERMVRPRLLPLTSRTGERLLGLVGLSFALALFLPLPFGNALPGFGLALIGLATLERDGLAAIVGMLAGAVGLLVVAGAAMGLVLAGATLARELMP